jgi:hypothetical protein
MNRSFSKIRHIQEANKRLEDRRLSVLTEQVDISKYEGSKTNPMDDTDMDNIKITKYQDEVEKKKMSPSDPIYQKIKDYFEMEFSPVTVIGIDEPIEKTMNPVYEVHFPSKNPNLKFQTFEVTIEDIDKKSPTLRTRFLGIFDDIDKTKKFEKTYRA